MKKTLLRNIFIAVICAILVGIIAITKDMNFATVRNGEEYTDVFLDGDIFEQELVLSHTGRIAVSLLPSYQFPEDSVGIAYELHMDDVVEEGFIPLAECSNNQWTYLEIQTNNRGFSGQAQLILQAVGLDQENTTHFLIGLSTQVIFHFCERAIALSNGSRSLPMNTPCVTMQSSFVVVTVNTYRIGLSAR